MPELKFPPDLDNPMLAKLAVERFNEGFHCWCVCGMRCPCMNCKECMCSVAAEGAIEDFSKWAVEHGYQVSRKDADNYAVPDTVADSVSEERPAESSVDFTGVYPDFSNPYYLPVLKKGDLLELDINVRWGTLNISTNCMQVEDVEQDGTIRVVAVATVWSHDPASSDVRIMSPCRQVLTGGMQVGMVLGFEWRLINGVDEPEFYQLSKTHIRRVARFDVPIGGYLRMRNFCSYMDDSALGYGHGWTRAEA